LKKNYGDNHPTTNNFALAIGGVGVPDGKGGSVGGVLDLIEFGEFGKELGFFRTKDGRAHPNGQHEAIEVTAKMYANDPVQALLVDLWIAAFENGLPGNTIPCSLTVYAPDGVTVGEAWEFEQCALRARKHNALDRAAGTAAEWTLTFLVYNPTRIPS